ncbi:MAG: metal-dependent hydrolase [Deltaproteobacteria bacterium]|jgi:inner membrane protein|nr:metal-dependent hydrolase [Deltaproteobacteria bacterium]
MDSVTHAVSGAALLFALPRRPATVWAVPLSMTVALFPDVDLVFPRIPIDFLLLHRGISHAPAALPAFALLCAALMHPFWKRGTPGAWTFRQTALFALLLLLLHVWLDCVTTYGTLAFLPFSDYRVRLNGLFIVDLWLTLPLVAICCVARRRPRIAALGMLWLMLYSGGAVAWRMHLEDAWNASLGAQGAAPAQLHVLPDAFSPLYWKVQYEQDGQCFQAPLAWNGAQIGPRQQGRCADAALLAGLAVQDRSASIWSRFSLLPLQDQQDWTGGREYRFHDWRFGSLVPLAQKIQDWRRNSATPFMLMVRVDRADKLVSVRYIGSAGGGDSGWQPPSTPKGRSGIHWLIGLDE